VLKFMTTVESDLKMNCAEGHKLETDLQMICAEITKLELTPADKLC
jgi:hypothetical protein